MEFESLKAVIDYAIEKEKEAADFYKSVSREEPMSGAKQMLEEFAQEERKHQTMLEKFQTEGIDRNLAEYRLNNLLAPTVDLTAGFATKLALHALHRRRLLLLPILLR